jgi:hypothetical protein
VKGCNPVLSKMVNEGGTIIKYKIIIKKKINDYFKVINTAFSG